MRLVYVAGPFRGPNAWAVECNIRKAEALSLEVWKLGAAAVCPHANSRFFDGALPDAVWLEGDLEILRRCDAVLLIDGWEYSKGATAEMQEAMKLGLPVFRTLERLRTWLEG